MLNDIKEYFRLFLKYTKGVRQYILIGSVIGIITNIVTLAVPFFTKFLIDVIIGQQNYVYFRYLLLTSIGILFLLLITSLLSNYLLFKYFVKSGIQLKIDVFKNLQFAPLEFYTVTPGGEISYRLLVDTGIIIDSWMNSLAAIPLQLIFLAAGVFMLQWHRDLALFVFLVLFFQVIVIAKFRKPLLSCSYQVKEKSQDISGYTVEHFSKIQLIRSLSMEKKEQSKFFCKLQELVEISLRSFMMSKFSSSITLVVNNLWSLGILWYGGMQVISGKITLGTLMAFLMFTNILYTPISVLVNFILGFQDVRVSLRRILAYLEIRPQVAVSERAINFNPPRGEILIKDCFFGYKEKVILKNVNLKIPSHTIFALVGPSGAGKTTLCRLIVRFYELGEGKIFLDEKDISEISFSSLRRSVLFTLQNEYVFTGTLWENLTYGSVDVDKKQVLIACEKAGLDFINKLPNGFNTKIGVNGMNFSAGEAQRIALARAFLLSPKVFILDEPTSFIDCETEEKIKSSLQILKQNSTIILIAHRLSTVMIADNAAVMDSGEIVETGKPSALLENKDSAFNKVYSLILSK